jgi:predicted transposase YbfD/YdcC
LKTPKDYLLEENLSAWKNVAMLVKIDVTREIKGIKQTETRYYISDDVLQKARYYAEMARGHWGIENHLHWHLDITFGEDASRVRKDHAPENLSIIRKFALQLLYNVNDKLSLKKRQYKAALDCKYLVSLLRI